VADDLRREAGYFREYQHRMNYLGMREQKFVIGSGMVEGGAKQYQARLCGPACARAGSKSKPDPNSHSDPERALCRRLAAGL